MDLNHSVHDDPGLVLDPVPSSNGDPLDVKPDLRDDLCLNMDFLIVPQNDESTSIRCINCGSDVTHRRRHTLSLVEVRHVILQWIAPQVIEGHSQICHSCWTVALNTPNVSVPIKEASSSSDSGRQRQLCVNCGKSLLRHRSHKLNIDSEQNRHIRNVIVDWINPLELRASDRICHPCWHRANRQAIRNVERVSEGEIQIPEGTIHLPDLRRARNVERVSEGEGEIQIPEGTIHLPDLRRAADTQSQCFFPGCNSVERLRIPKWLRVHVFAEYNYYIPQNCRSCQFHIQKDNLHIIGDDTQCLRYFTASHIQDFASFVKERTLRL